VSARPARDQRRPSARPVRIVILGMASGFVVVSVALGFAVHALWAALVCLSLAALSLSLTALMLRDGALLPRARSLARWETRALGLLLSLAAMLGVAIVIDYAITPKHVALTLGLVGVGVALICGALALYSLLRR